MLPKGLLGMGCRDSGPSSLWLFVLEEFQISGKLTVQVGLLQAVVQMCDMKCRTYNEYVLHYTKRFQASLPNQPTQPESYLFSKQKSSTDMLNLTFLVLDASLSSFSLLLRAAATSSTGRGLPSEPMLASKGEVAQRPGTDTVAVTHGELNLK